MATTAASTASHTVTAPAATLSTDLAFIANLSTEQLGAFCTAARDLLRKPDDTAMFGKAAKALGVDTATVTASVRAPLDSRAPRCTCLQLPSPPLSASPTYSQR